MRRDEEVKCSDRRIWVKQGPQHERRRENERLRVGDTGMPPVMVGVPERCLTGMHGGGEEAEEGIELVFGVPGNDRVSHDPMAGGEQPDEGDSQGHECRTEPCVCACVPPCSLSCTRWRAAAQ